MLKCKLYHCHILEQFVWPLIWCCKAFLVLKWFYLTKIGWSLLLCFIFHKHVLLVISALVFHQSISSPEIYQFVVKSCACDTNTNDLPMKVLTWKLSRTVCREQRFPPNGSPQCDSSVGSVLTLSHKVCTYITVVHGHFYLKFSPSWSLFSYQVLANLRKTDFFVLLYQQLCHIQLFGFRQLVQKTQGTWEFWIHF